MAFSEKNLKALIKVAMEHGASDIHIRTDETPCLRIKGTLVPVQTRTFSIEDVRDITEILVKGTKHQDKINDISELDGGHQFEGLCRARYNFFRYGQKIGIILRLIKNQIPTIDELGISPSIKKICEQTRGLILITGATGSGKSTTLAAMINRINHKRSAHIVTIEDPLEYLHPQIKSRITQREIGIDTENFSTALRSALRQDPDIILIGEMRDAETISIALQAAETGHLVLSTVHTRDCVSTVGRIISMFPEDEQPYVQKRLAEHLYSTISQRMIPGVSGDIVVAQEIMVTGPGVRECILGQEPLSRLGTILAQGKITKQSQSFDQHILELYNNGVITKEVALESVASQSDFMQKLLIE
jgi:twitching motility protein PilT